MPKGTRFLPLLPCMNGESAARRAASSCYQSINDSGGVFAHWLHLEFIEVISLQWQWQRKSDFFLKQAVGTFSFPWHQFDSSVEDYLHRKCRLLLIIPALVAALVLGCSSFHLSDTTLQHSALLRSESNLFPGQHSSATFPVTWHLTLHLNGSRLPEAYVGQSESIYLQFMENIYNEMHKERFWFWISSIPLGCCYEVILHGSSLLACFLWLFNYSTFPAIGFSFSTWLRAELELSPDLLISLEAADQKKKDKKTWQQDW